MSTPQRIQVLCAQLGPDELAVLACLAERLVIGRRSHGELRIGRDTRDFGARTTREVLDVAVWAAMGLLAQGTPA